MVTVYAAIKLVIQSCAGKISFTLKKKKNICAIDVHGKMSGILVPQMLTLLV